MGLENLSPLPFQDLAAPPAAEKYYPNFSPVGAGQLLFILIACVVQQRWSPAPIHPRCAAILEKALSHHPSIFHPQVAIST